MKSAALGKTNNLISHPPTNDILWQAFGSKNYTFSIESVHFNNTIHRMISVKDHSSHYIEQGDLKLKKHASKALELQAYSLMVNPVTQN
jgi:hypothetical protein